METDSIQIKEDENITDTGKNRAMVFDMASGFSAEEQQEILDRINSLTVEKGIIPQAGLLKTEAKKRGVLFPMLVNLAALLILAGGFFLLWLFHGRDEQDIREGGAVLGLTERTLIQEIRKETSRQLTEKEREINGILSRLQDAGEEYRELQASVETLTEEQQERAAYLLAVQDEYRKTLSLLEDDRSKILEDSRMREASLRAQAEERTKELAAQIEQGQVNLGAAMEELARISGDQERAAAAEAQLGGYYTILANQITTGQNAEAALMLVSMRSFLTSSLFQASRSLDARRQTHLAAVGSLETLVDALRRLEGTDPAPLPSDGDGGFREQVAALEQRIQDQERTIAAFNSQDTEQGRMIAGFETTISELRSANSNQQQTLNQRDAAIQELRTQHASQEQRIAELSAAASQLQSGSAALSRSNEELRRLMESIPQVVEQAVEQPAIQDLLGPAARQAIRQTIQQAIQQAIQQ
jgi:chromosome segregation ATPase